MPETRELAMFIPRLSSGESEMYLYKQIGGVREYCKGSGAFKQTTDYSSEEGASKRRISVEMPNST